MKIHSPRVYLDSDVVISSLISNAGASYEIFQTHDLNLIISDKSEIELKKVVNKLNLALNNLKDRLSACQKIDLDTTDKYTKFVTDPNDVHIIAGAAQSQSRFLLTYNEKHFNIENIKRDLNILVMPPGKFLQYLRSRI